MMQQIRPFGQVGNTVNLPVTAASTRVAVTRPNVGTQSVRILVSGTDVVYLTFGDVTVVSTVATGMPMLGGTIETFLLPNGTTHIAAIAAGTASTIFVTTGESA